MPKPCMKENSLSYIRALKLFEIHQYPAAALEIRKGFEKLFCNLYPKNWTKSINFQENNIFVADLIVRKTFWMLLRLIDIEIHY